MFEIIGTVVTVIAVTGVIFNNHKMTSCFYLWMVSNTLSAVIHLHLECYSLFTRDVIFLVLAVHGLYQWRKTPNPKH